MHDKYSLLWVEFDLQRSYFVKEFFPLRWESGVLILKKLVSAGFAHDEIPPCCVEILESPFFAIIFGGPSAIPNNQTALKFEYLTSACYFDGFRWMYSDHDTPSVY